MTALKTEKLSTTKTGSTPDTVIVALAEKADAAAIAEAYEAALGKDGVMAPGHDPYPDPSLFTKEGIEGIADSDERRLVIAKLNGKVAGGMMIDRLSPLHCEFNSMAVRLDMRGRRIGSKIVQGARKVLDDSLFTVNCTELVTHSLMSQSAHFSEGFDRICGFSFCHYPNVFFADHPESVLWVALLQGRLVESLKELRKHLGRNAGTSTTAVYAKTKNIVGKLAGQGLVCDELNDSTDSLYLASEILRTRPIYLPESYLPLAESILIQFRDILEYDLASEGTNTSADTRIAEGKLTVNYVEGYAHSYISYSPRFTFRADELDRAIESVKKLGKRFMLVRIPTNDQETPSVIAHLLKQGFVFQSLLPLYGFQCDTEGKPELYDIVTMQWIAPHILEKNPLPGETNSVVKLHGYPENLSGDILRLIRKEIGMLNGS